jgi:hypothetical protein
MQGCPGSSHGFYPAWRPALPMTSDDAMSFGALLTALGASVVGGMPVPSERADFLELSSSALATESSVMNSRSAATRPDKGNDRSDARTLSPPASSPLPDIALYLGNPRSGPELELGALGGGRLQTPGLVHLGFGMNF